VNLIRIILKITLLCLLAVQTYAVDPTFNSKIDYQVGTDPQSLFAADLDGDGDQDLAVANLNTANVSVLKNNGNGTFGGAVNYGTGSSAHSVYAADLDGDGDLDLAVASFANFVSVLKNNGDGTFGVSVNYPATGSPASIFAEDFDGDGKQDIVTANWSGNSVTVRINNGDGTFPFLGITHIIAPTSDNGPFSVYAADLDGDGKPDLATANYNTQTISILTKHRRWQFHSNGTVWSRQYPCICFCH